jgi:hypothetical protein
VFRDPLLIGYSLAIAPAAFILLGCGLVAMALRPYGRIVAAQ